MRKTRVTKGAAIALARPSIERLMDMPLARGRMAKASLSFTTSMGYLALDNLEAPLVWELDLLRPVAKSDAGFEPPRPEVSLFGNREVRALAGVSDIPATLVEKIPEGAPAAVDGQSEFGLQTPDEKEYFFSKFGDLVGVVRMSRKGDGSWGAKMAKTFLPRVVSKEAVQGALMPPLGHSALPRSLEQVVPPEYHYWKQQDPEAARATRDALVESGFFTEDTIKTVDGEMRKVEQKFFLYTPPAADPTVKRLPRGAVTFSERLERALPSFDVVKIFNPFESDDWLEDLDKNDSVNSFAVLSAPVPPSPRELARAVATLKGAWLVDCPDSPAARTELDAVGVIFKIAGESCLFASSFSPSIGTGVQLAKADALKVTDFQGIPVHIDRPIGFVQTGKDAQGNDWSRTYQNDYGFIPKTMGGDGMELDVFLGPNPDSKRAFWVTQKTGDGTFDEYKIFLGFDAPREVLDVYAAHIPIRHFSDMMETTTEMVKALIGLSPAEVVKCIAKDATHVEKPFAGFKDFAACHAAQIRQGKSGESADKICGALQRDLEKFGVLKVVQKAAEEQYVLGIVLEPNIVDAQNDTYSAEEIRQCAQKFMEEFRNVGLMHKQFVNDEIKIVESYIAPADFDLGGIAVRKGTWLMGCRVLSPELWALVKNGGLTGFSIGGSAVREPLTTV